MRLWTIAQKTRECYGQGDFGNEFRICRQGAYGSGEYPPVFEDHMDATEWFLKNNLSPDGHVIVELRFVPSSAKS